MVCSHLVNGLFPTPIRKEGQNSSQSHGRGNNIHSALPQGYVNGLALCHNIIPRAQDHLDIPRSIPRSITQSHYVSDTVPIPQDEQEVSLLEARAKSRALQCVANKALKIQGATALVMFAGVQ